MGIEITSEATYSAYVTNDTKAAKSDKKTDKSEVKEEVKEEES